MSTRHTATGDYAHDLAMLASQRAQIERQIYYRVLQARDAGQTWTDLGACLGVTKQAAQQRYGKKPAKNAGHVSLEDQPLPFDPQ